MSEVSAILIAWASSATMATLVALGLVWYMGRQARDQQEEFRAQRREDRLAHGEQMQALTNLLHYGTATPPPAVVSPAEPDHETRAQRKIDAETLARGVAAMRAEYQRVGIHGISDEELRDEVESMMYGVAPTPRDITALLSR